MPMMCLQLVAQPPKWPKSSPPADFTDLLVKHLDDFPVDFLTSTNSGKVCYTWVPVVSHYSTDTKAVKKNTARQ